jgi:F-box/leucine-rich repeat protein 16
MNFRFVQWEEMWKDPKFLARFFWFFSPYERHILAQVCSHWRDVLYRPVFWRDQRPVLHCRAMRSWTDNEPDKREWKRNFFQVRPQSSSLTSSSFTLKPPLQSLIKREFDTAVLFNASDADVFDFVQNFPEAAKLLHGLTLRCCNVSDRGLEALLEFLQALFQLEIAGCNEVRRRSCPRPSLIDFHISLS